MSETQVGGRIREARHSRGLSQAALGGGRFSGSYISYIESGRRQPTPELLEFLAAQLGVELTELSGPSADSADLDAVGWLLAARRALANGQPDVAGRDAGRAADIAHASGLETRRLEADLVHAQALFAAARYGEAGDLAEELSGRPLAARSADLRCEALTLAARSRRASGRLGQAVELAQRAISGCSEADAELRTEALGAFISANAEAGHLDRVGAAAAELAELAPRTSLTRQGMIAWTLGNLAFLQGNPERGMQLHRQADELIDPRVDLQLYSRLQRVTADFLLRNNQNLGEAAERWERARTGLMLVGNAGDLIDLRLTQAWLLFRQAHHDRAIALVRSCLDEQQVADDPRVCAEAHELLAQVQLAAGDRSGAQASFRAAAAKYEQADAAKQALAAWRAFASVVS